ncbi:DUF382-domain-containing protein, partial [Piedraia hortae CBS 480.64]
MPGVVAKQKTHKPTKNEQRRAKKKAQRQAAAQTSTQPEPPKNDAAPSKIDSTPPKPQAQDYNYDDTVEEVDIPTDDPIYSQFATVFAKFATQDEVPDDEVKDKQVRFHDDEDNIQGEDEEAETQKRLSKKARKAANKLSVAELKAIARKPELVEGSDTSAQDPKLLVNIKSAKNVVPVPAHWSLKRDYLSSKRGVEKVGFALPKFIAETGIAEMRDAALEKQAEATLKQKQRERVQGKLGKLDIDYQKLYEAFFRRQTKPALTRYGEVYYEGKEHETNLRHLRPGCLSLELQEALNMPPGAPPPWLINMQRFGPPPSYPALKIAGLNAPLPPGAQWGYHPGGYGKPPVDEQNRPLWGGDLFGTAQVEEVQMQAEPVDKTLWGELLPFEEEEEEDDDEEDEDEEMDREDAGEKI